MYKKQMVLQRYLCLAVLIVSAVVFVYSLGIMTDLYDSLYGTYRRGKTSISGAEVYMDMQGFNKLFLRFSIGMILLSMLLFVTNTHSRRRYYVGNYFAVGLFSAAGVTSPVTLQMNGVGGLFQVGETADSGKVKSVLNGEHGGKLASQFALAAARSAILEAAKDPQFTSDYNANPPATMEKYENQLKDLMLRCQLTLDKGQVTTGFAAA